MKKRLGIITITALVVIAAVYLFLSKIYVVPVLMYHSIDHNDLMTKLSVSPESFVRQMGFLHSRRYNIVGLDKVASYISKKEKAPPKTLAITFDDGYYNNYQYAYPVLKKYNIPATIFVIVDKIGEPGYVGWKELKEMSDSGVITIGSHTVSHKWLPSLGSDRLKDELERSKRIIEEKLGKEVDFLCYPIGAVNDRVERAAKDAGYYCAVGTNPRRFAPDDIFAIKRIKISRTSNSMFVFWIETSGYYTWIKEQRDE